MKNAFIVISITYMSLASPAKLMLPHWRGREEDRVMNEKR